MDETTTNARLSHEEKREAIKALLDDLSWAQAKKLNRNKRSRFMRYEETLLEMAEEMGLDVSK